jgi:hypothetical protein
MPTWLTFFISLVLVVGGLAGLYMLIVFLVGGLRVKASPRMGIVSAGGKGSIGVWVTWKPEQFAVQVYRLRFNHVSPDCEVKEGTFTVTFDTPQTAPFLVNVELPPNFQALLERDGGKKAIFTIEMKTVEELTLPMVYTLNTFRKVYKGEAKGSVPKGVKVLPPMKEDVPTVFSLDFSELTVRRKKLKDLEAAAKAKAAAKAAAPAPAAKPAVAAAAAAPAPAPAAKATAAPAPAQAAKPAAATAAPAPEAQPADKAVGSSPAPASAQAPKSVRDVVSASNATKKVSEVSDKSEDKP